MSDSSHPGNAPEPGPADPPPPLPAVHDERVLSALRQLEHAQKSAAAAEQMLGLVESFRGDAGDVHAVYQQLGSLWLRINGRRLTGKAGQS